MKDNFQKYMMIAFLIIFSLIAVNLTINNIKPSKFYCEDKLIAEQLTPIDFQNMFNSCLNKCKTGELECIQACVLIIDFGLNQGVIKIETNNSCGIDAYYLSLKRGS